MDNIRDLKSQEPKDAAEGHKVGYLMSINYDQRGKETKNTGAGHKMGYLLRRTLDGVTTAISRNMMPRLLGTDPKWVFCRGEY